jgi:hypothetical protein
MTQCVLGCEDWNISKNTSIIDYCIYFVYQMVAALLKNEKSIFNKGIGYMKIYYDILDSLFSLDSNTKREEGSENPESEEPAAQHESIFGADAKLTSFKDFSDYHLKWAKQVVDAS